MSTTLPKYIPFTFLDEILDERVKESFNEQVYTLDFITVKMGWGLSRVDEELRKGNIVRVGRNGKIGFRFNCELGQTRAQQNRSQYAREPVMSRIGMQVRNGSR